MSNLILSTNKANSIPLSTSIVYAGKSGTSSDLGVSYVSCIDYTTSITDITFNLSNLHLIYEDYFSNNAKANVSNLYIQAPISQFVSSNSAIRNSGYYNYQPYITLEVKNSNLKNNTVTVYDKEYNNVKQSSLLMTPKFSIKVFQPELLGNTIYLSGTTKLFNSYENVVNVTGTSQIDLPVVPKFKNDIKVYLDDKAINDFVWPVSGNYSQISLTLDGSYSNLRVTTEAYTVPTFEANDIVSLSLAKNNYSIASTSYLPGDVIYNAELTNNKYYKIKLNKNIYKNISGIKLINISTDLVGRVIAKTNSNITVSYDNSYPYSYNLANNNVYYIYKKSTAQFNSVSTDELGRIPNVPNGIYIVKAANINKYNRVSPTVSAAIEVEPIALSKIDDLTVTEEVTIDSVAGAVINATISFPPITDRDVLRYSVKYQVAPTESEDSILDSNYSKQLIAQNTQVSYLQAKINNIYRGRESNSNSLYVSVTPLNGGRRGFTKKLKHPIVGKITKPNGLKTFTVAQNGDSLLFNWSLVLTTDGFLADLDAKEVEVREYPGAIDITNINTVEAAWSVSLDLFRTTYNSTSYTIPTNKYGTYTYLAKVRDTSDLESEKIAAFVITIEKPETVITYRAYNEGNSAISYSYNGSTLVPNSNLYPEASFSSVRQSNTDGLVSSLLKSTHTDNANGSSSGFSVVSGYDAITTGAATSATYITPIRDVGRIIKGSIKLDLGVTISNRNITFNTLYDTIFSGVTDYHLSEGYPVSANVLVDNAFGGIGYILGNGNANAATVSYNSYHRTLTSGGPYGNVYAIRGTSALPYNANSYAKIAGILGPNVIALGEVFDPSGNYIGSNNYNNVSLAGNSYELVNMAQFVDPDGQQTFIGPVRNIDYNVYIRYATSNVYYSNTANGVVGLPYHGNTNVYAFTNIFNSDPETAWIPYVPGELRFRYFQIKVDVANKQPAETTVTLDNFKYQVDLKKKLHSNTITIPSGVIFNYDYSYLEYLNIPTVNTQKINNANTRLIVVADNISKNSIDLSIVDSQTNMLYTSGDIDVSVVVTGI